MQIYLQKSCEKVYFATQMTLIGWICGFELRGKGGDDETSEGGIELVGRCAEELGVGASDVLLSGFTVLDVTVLPISKTVGIGHLGFAKGNRLQESADGTLSALGKRSGVRVADCVSVSATVASTHDDTFFAREFATKMVKRKCGFYFSHMSNKLGSCHSETIVLFA